ncbi:MAG: DNA mismatch repair endonuclease MutL [Deltaproteobacteria bacterium]|nr:DNA mismatch repair endonuclease MutL [Deltaproteobacteria bacterium]
MTRIERLPEAVANQIAAGEVVERPASVVKELVENAIDAQAGRIEVEIAGGGVDLVRVRDDGLGMEPDDAVRCLERHATSKLRQLADLESLVTLGFRGEAIPSIASVSRFVLITQPRGAAEGTRVSVEGGGAPHTESAGAPAGTTVEVRDLFYNVPARRKFLKSHKTELGHVTETMVRIALSRPDLALRLSSDGRTILDIPRGSEIDPYGRLGRILGSEVAEHLFALPEVTLDVPLSVRGYAAAPRLSERTTRALYTFVNGRFVRDRTVQHAVQEGYRTLLERGRYPVVLLLIEIDPARVDVNVHPQKTEVRFERSGDVHRAITTVLTRGLASQPWLDRSSEQGAAGVLALARSAAAGSSRSLSPPLPYPHPHPYPQPMPMQMPMPMPARPAGREPDRWPRLASEARAPSAWALPQGHSATGPVALGPPPTELVRAGEPARFAALEPVGQVLSTYLVCQGPGRMIVIDPHAAHERIAFERMRRQRAGGRIEAQPLLVPRTLELDPVRSALAVEAGEQLLSLGFELEPFGGSTWILKSVPAALGRVDVDRLLRDVLDELKEIGEARAPVSDAMDAILSCAACHTVVRAGDRLAREEIKALLVQMDEIDFGAHCPHGRPVFVEWTERDLAALFHRR